MSTESIIELARIDQTFRRLALFGNAPVWRENLAPKPKTQCRCRYCHSVHDGSRCTSCGAPNDVLASGEYTVVQTQTIREYMDGHPVERRKLERAYHEAETRLRLKWFSITCIWILAAAIWIGAIIHMLQ